MRGVFLFLALVMCSTVLQSQQTKKITPALNRALAGTHASGVVLDWNTGAEIARYGEEVRTTPGSVVKPLLLSFALEHGFVSAKTQVYCRRDLHIGNHDVSCTHPRDQPLLNAEMALAESCNTWFAAMGMRLTGAQLESALRETKLPHRDMTDADVPTRQLAVLGLENVTASPRELAQSYQRMLLKAPPDDVVVRAMKESVAFGMASPARVESLDLLGKTGTANSPGDPHTHGWFAGALPGRWIVVLYVPRGDGGAAASLAKRFFIEAAK